MFYYSLSKFKKEIKNYLIKLDKSTGVINYGKSIFNVFKFSEGPSFYDNYWKQNKKNKTNWNYGINIVDNLITNYDFHSVLDAGCGSGDVVRYLLSKGYSAKGVELSNTVLKEYAKDLIRKRKVKQGSLTKLPYPDNSFDVVFSSEVLEHIHEEDIPKVVSELVRVCKKILFLTISLRPSSNFNKYHITLKSREWWEDEFLKHPIEKEQYLVSQLQKKKDGASTKEIMELGPTKTHIEEMEWFINDPNYDLKGELEPWYFIFKKNE